MVYLITCKKTNTCKIGYANDPLQRLSGVQVGNPFKLQLKYTITGNRTTEKKLHRKFKQYRLLGEWFTYSEKIEAYFSNHLEKAYFTFNPEEDNTELIKIVEIMVAELNTLSEYALGLINFRSADSYLRDDNGKFIINPKLANSVKNI